jgi:uncharacterized protein YjdB
MRTLAPLALILLVAVGACDPAAPAPPAGMTPGGLPPNLVVGDRIDAVTVTVEDADGRPVRGAEVAWSVSAGSVDPALSVTDDRGRATTSWTLGTVPGDQTLTARAGDVETSFVARPGPGPATEISLTPASRTLESIGDTLDIVAAGEDEYGNATILPGLSWSSSAPSVASVVDGRVIAHGEGRVTISAISGGASGSAEVVVDQVVVGLGLTPAAPIMVIGETWPLTADAIDARATPVDTTVTVTWSTSDDTVADVDDAGNVTAIGAGLATVTAVAGPLSADAVVDVRDAERPTITAISPAVLTAGDTATITGTGFSSNAALDHVSVAGMDAAVLSATPTRLSVQVAPPGSFPCMPTADLEVLVSVDGLEVRRDHPVGGARQLSLAVGEAATLFDHDVACNEVGVPGSYVLAVFNGASSPSTSSAFRLRGTGAGMAPLAADRVRPRIALPVETPALEPDPEAVAHHAVLEESLRLVERLGTPRYAPRPAATAAAAIGDLGTFRIPNLDDPSSACSDYATVTARVVYAGTHAIIWEDTLAPVAGQMDAKWDEIGSEYDDVMHPILLQYFGDPLALGESLDADGRIAMLFSEEVNDFDRSVAGFVWSGDFYPRTQCASSDSRELFYGVVPTSSATGYGDGTVEAWAWQMRSTVVHEAKHIAAYATKLALNATSLEDTGLEESTARIAEELYGRALQGYDQFDNVGYQASIWCERRVGANYPACDPVPLIMGKHYSSLNTYLKTPAALSPLGPATADESSYYGSGWQFVRWVVDQSGQDEAQFLSALVSETQRTGPANLVNQAGRPLRELLADYALAIAVDDHPSGMVPARAAHAMPGWNTRDIFEGLHDDYAGTDVAVFYPTPWPLATTSVDPGDFEVTVAEVRGGSAAFFTLSGTTGPQLLELLNESGSGSVSSFVGLAIVRVQ